MALWSGRFEQKVAQFTQEFGASLPIDRKMFKEDIEGSRAHAKMLADQGIISQSDLSAINEGLLDIEQDIESGQFEFDINDEDIHMAIEKVLIDKIGDAGARLHTARSRNDQVITDTRLYAKKLIIKLLKANRDLREILVKASKINIDIIVPGYTHLQHAQPVLLSHHIMAYFWMFSRDYQRLLNALKATNKNPLGSAALAGTTFPIDREQTTKDLGFSEAIPNSLDAVSDRDFLLDLDYACSVSMIHLSRMSEEIILWSSSEFGFITLSDSYSTGSSIMPQKKNPDFAELIRGKTGRVIGDLVALLTTMKSLPLAYNKDLQEDKEGVFDACQTLSNCLECMKGIIATTTINSANINKQLNKGFIAATDMADYLAKKGLPFRKAHEIVGHLVLLCEKRGCRLDELDIDDFKKESDLFDNDVFDVLNLNSIVDTRNSFGGTSTKNVLEQIKSAKQQLENEKDVLKMYKF